MEKIKGFTNGIKDIQTVEGIWVKHGVDAVEYVGSVLSMNLAMKAGKVRKFKNNSDEDQVLLVNNDEKLFAYITLDVFNTMNNNLMFREGGNINLNRRMHLTAEEIDALPAEQLQLED